MGLGAHLLGAACVHAVVVAAVAHLRPPPPVTSAFAVSAEIDIAIERAPAADLLALAESASARPAALRSEALRSAAPVDHRAPPAASPVTGALVARAPDVAVAGEPDLALALHAAPVDLGTDSYWRAAAAGAVSTGSASSGSAQPETAQVNGVARMMRDETEARDVGLGLGSSGPLVSAARAAASIPSAPDVGRISVDIDCDSDGKVVSARLRGAASKDWEGFRQELVRLMATRSLRVPAGAHGLRVSLRIESERRLPSGKEVSAHPGAVPDDMPAGIDPKGCEGTGLTRKCASGMPIGITFTGADVTNLAARAHRMIRVALEGETRL